MAGKKALRWQDLDHTDEPLFEHQVGARSVQTSGPIPEFLAKKTAERAAKTHEWYRDSLMQLWEFLEQRDLTSIGQFSEHAVNLFRAHLRQRGVSENTISNRLRAIKAFGRWMGDKGWTDGNVLRDLKVPQSTKPRFDLIPDDVRGKVFQLYPAETYLGSRNLAILAVLSDTGLRREEVANLLLKNLDLDAQVLKVYSDKTEDWRYVPLTDEVVSLLRNHLKWRERYYAQPARRCIRGDQNRRRREPRSVCSDRLFLTANGKALSPNGVGLIFERASKKVGYRVHAHLFRHDWITRKALDGESPSIVKRWAGHKSYAMTDYYFGLAEEMLGAIKPKRSVLGRVPLPGVRRRGRPPRRP
jgi:site-specific recombinase XerD